MWNPLDDDIPFEILEVKDLGAGQWEVWYWTVADDGLREEAADVIEATEDELQDALEDFADEKWAARKELNAKRASELSDSSDAPSVNIDAITRGVTP